MIQVVSNVDLKTRTSTTIVMVDLILWKSTLQRRSNLGRVMQAPYETMNQISRTNSLLSGLRLKVLACFVLCLAAALALTDSSTAQEPDESVDGATGPALTQPDDASLTETERIILRTVQASNPQTAQELAKAASVLVEIELFDDARFYLGQIDKLGLDQTQMFELNDKIGSDFFLFVYSNIRLQPEGSRLAKQVMAASRSQAGSPARINQLIKTLSDENISVRSDAFRKLRQLGEPAAAAMLNVFADPERTSDYPGIRGALKHMGVHSQGPLLGAAYASDAQVRAEAIRALGNYESTEANDSLMRAYLSPKVPAHLQRIALEAITKDGAMPADRQVIEKRLYDRSLEYLMGNRKYAGALLGSVVLWHWDAKKKEMVPSEVSTETAARVVASRRAEDLYEIRPDLARNREIYLLTQLEAEKRVVGKNERVNAEVLSRRLAVSPDEIESTLDRAIKLELVPAAIACCELLERFGTEANLTAHSTRPGPLVNAILFGDRFLQYAAFEAITRIDPQQAYTGSSYVTSLATFLAQSDNRASGLVGHNQSAVGQTFAAELGSSGVLGVSVSNSRDFFRQATSSPDIEMLFVTDTLVSPHYAELIQQLRNDWRTRRLPIAFMFRDFERRKRVSFRFPDDDLLLLVPFSDQPGQVATNVVNLAELYDPWRISNVDRRRHAAAAVRWLAKVSSDRKQYCFYDLGSSHDSLARLLYSPGFAEQGSKILASLGTPSAQRELVNFASQSGQPVGDREKVVQAFADSVATGGTLLTTAEIQQQYDRYNASKTESEESQKLLGTILDVIEAKANR